MFSLWVSCQRIIVFIVITFFLAGCASELPPLNDMQNQSAAQIYAVAQRAVKIGRYDDATEYYDLINATYPFSRYARQGSLETIYAYYKAEEFTLGIAASERYIHLYPRDPDVDYAYYMKGLLNFFSGINWIHRYLPLSVAQNDLTSMRQAFDSFGELIALFPHSRYANDARRHRVYIRNLLAERELQVARFYYDRSAYVAAANRASGIIKYFNGSPQVLPALRLMINAYRKAGDMVLANKMQRLLNYNQARLTKRF